MRRKADSEQPGEIGIAPSMLAFIVVKARAFDAQAGVSGLEEGSNASDDREMSALEGGADDATREELRAAIASLTIDQRVALVALTWIGRGDFSPQEWTSACALAAERRTGATARYLLGMPMFGDYLEEGASALGLDLAGEEAQIMS